MSATHEITPEEARDAILAGKTVRMVVGPTPEDPICLQYLDRTFEFYGEPMIFTESIGGWSEGAKEAICDPESDFYLDYTSSPPPLSLIITDEVPPQRESREPVAFNTATQEGR